MVQPQRVNRRGIILFLVVVVPVVIGLVMIIGLLNMGDP